MAIEDDFIIMSNYNKEISLEESDSMSSRRMSVNQPEKSIPSKMSENGEKEKYHRAKTKEMFIKKASFNRPRKDFNKQRSDDDHIFWVSFNNQELETPKIQNFDEKGPRVKSSRDVRLMKIKSKQLEE